MVPYRAFGIYYMTFYQKYISLEIKYVSFIDGEKNHDNTFQASFCIFK